MSHRLVERTNELTMFSSVGQSSRRALSESVSVVISSDLYWYDSSMSYSVLSQGTGAEGFDVLVRSSRSFSTSLYAPGTSTSPSDAEGWEPTATRTAFFTEVRAGIGTIGETPTMSIRGYRAGSGGKVFAE